MKYHFFFLGSAGDFFPVFRTAIELKRRGHECRFVSFLQYSWIKPFVEKEGFEYLDVDLGVSVGHVEMPGFADEEAGEQPCIEAEHFHQFSRCFDYVARNRNSAGHVYVGTSFFYLVKIACERFRLPFVYVSYSPNFLDEEMGFDKKTIEFKLSVANSILENYNLSPMDSMSIDWFLEGAHSMAYFPRWISGKPLENAFYCGFPFSHINPIDSDSPLSAFLASSTNNKIVAFTPGTSLPKYDIFADIVYKACMDIGVKCIVVMRDRGGFKILPEHEDSVLYLEYADFESLFGRIDLLIHHGGVGTMSEAIRAGVPQVVKPMFWDQFYNGEIVNKAFLGEVINEVDFNISNVSSLVHKILSDEIVSASCKNYSERVKSNNGAFVAAEYLSNINTGIDESAIDSEYECV